MYGAHDVPYVHDAGYAAGIRDDERVKRVLVWDNQVGVVLSHAGNVGLENTGNAHTYWVPKGDYTGKGGTHLTDPAGAAPNNAVDTVRGGPGLWREHMFSVDVRGYDRMFVEWRGEVTAASGFALTGAGLSLPRSYYFSVGVGWATGTFTSEDTLRYMREPPVVCYNAAQEGNNASALGGATTDGVEAAQIAGGMPLWCNGMGPLNRQNQTDARLVKTHGAAPSLMWDLKSNGSGPLSVGGMLWGRQQTNITGTDTSRHPLAGDRLYRAMQIGYSNSVGAFEGNGAVGEMWNRDFKISGLARVWFAIAELFPETAASVGLLWPGGPASKLDWATSSASMTIIGKIHVILIRDH